MAYTVNILTELINVTAITFIVSYIIDLSGIIQSIKNGLWYLFVSKKVPVLDYQLPLIECSKCMTFWVVLLYGIISGYGIIQLLFVACIMSYLSNFISGFLISTWWKLHDYINKEK